MMLIRPVQPEDLDQLVELAAMTGFGLTTLPKDPRFLRNRIARSQRSFDRHDEDDPRGKQYLFVMEELTSRKVVGTTAIVSKVGGFDPFYSYRLTSVAHRSAVLKVDKEIRLLTLVVEHDGPSEIGSLFLDEHFRHSGHGRLLSLARFLFIAEFPEDFDPTVIAEMRGVIDDQGESPFWDAVGRPFFEVDFPTADYLSMVNKKFIAELMPAHPIYVDLLPPPARQVIGQVHEKTRPALRLLRGEGFQFSGMVDIFEAGPVVSCPRDQIRTLRESRLAEVNEIAMEPMKSEVFVISNARRDFRACLGPVQEIGQGKVRLARDCAEALGVAEGSPVRYAPLYPGGERKETL